MNLADVFTVHCTRSRSYFTDIVVNMIISKDLEPLNSVDL